MNCDNHREICERASIRAYPTVRYYQGSIDSKRQVTLRTDEKIRIECEYFKEFNGEDIANLDGDFIFNYVNQQLQQKKPSNVQHTTEL